ncbi:hypothetical protein [Pseudomonas syringae]|uniref:hypothetical protein n=1 Tax=Pseudomonas syringae TaxID=317 RepID=UPI0012AE3707|nr:hypothetical protein [Pseudomonas syringae]
MSVARFYHDDNEPSIFCLQALVEAIHQANLYETGIGVRWVRRKFGTFRHDEMSGFAPPSMLGGPAPLGACRKLKTVEHLIQLPHLWQRWQQIGSIIFKNQEITSIRPQLKLIISPRLMSPGKGSSNSIMNVPTTTSDFSKLITLAKNSCAKPSSRHRMYG